MKNPSYIPLYLNELIQRYATTNHFPSYSLDSLGRSMGLTRRDYTKKYSWAIPSLSALETIINLGPLIEVGAGNGYWTYELIKLGANIIPTDISADPIEENYYGFNKIWAKPKPMKSTEAVLEYTNRTMLMIWPNCGDSWAYETLKSYQQNTFVYIGEGQGGCNANDDFFDLLGEWEVEYHEIPRWDFIRDYMMVCRRKQ